MAYRPWKLFRFVLRVILSAVLAWFVLALLWAFIPSPLRDHDPDNGSIHATSRLRAGKTLTRVYEQVPPVSFSCAAQANTGFSSSRYFRIEHNNRQGFAIDYKLDMNDLTITIDGADHPLPIFKQGQTVDSVTEQINATARIGDRDGANLPWFEFADAVLLYWWIQKDDLQFLVDITWTVEEDGEDFLRRMEVRVAGRPGRRALLTLEMQGSDTSSIVVEAPERPYSFSPSETYPVRVALIHVIAPTAVFVNGLLGGFVGQAIESVVTTIFVLFVIAVYGFFALAIMFSIGRCVGGPSFEVVVERTQARLDNLRENERLRGLRIEALQERLERLCQNERFKRAVEICRNGWHPEREMARAAEVEIDVEKEASPKEGLD